MSVDRRILNEFVKITNDRDDKTESKILHGTIVSKNGKDYVKMDGSDIATPFRSTIDVKDKDRVVLDVRGHMATVTGNLSDPSASGGRVTEVEDEVDRWSVKVSDNAGKIAKLEITSESITSSVKDLDGKYTEVKQTSDTITNRVNGLDGKYTELKQTVDGIDVTGMVTFHDLETPNNYTKINGGNIKTNSLIATGEIGFANGARITPFPSQISGSYGMEISAPQIKIAGNSMWSVSGAGDASFESVTADGSMQLIYKYYYSPYAGGGMTSDTLTLGGCILAGASSSSMHLVSSSGGRATMYANVYGSYDLPPIAYGVEDFSAFDIIDNTSVINKCILPNTTPLRNDDMEPYLEVTPDGVNVNHSNCISLLWKAVQELKEENKILKEKLGVI